MGRQRSVILYQDRLPFRCSFCGSKCGQGDVASAQWFLGYFLSCSRPFYVLALRRFELAAILSLQLRMFLRMHRTNSFYSSFGFWFTFFFLLVSAPLVWALLALWCSARRVHLIWRGKGGGVSCGAKIRAKRAVAMQASSALAWKMVRRMCMSRAVFDRCYFFFFTFFFSWELGIKG